MDNEQGHGTWNTVQCCMAAWMGGEFGEEWIHVHLWLSPFIVSPENYHNIVNQLYPPIENKKFKLNKNEIKESS